MKKKNTALWRFLVMLAILVIAAIGYFTTFGLGTVCGFGIDSITLLCPLGALLAMIAERTAIPMALISIVVVLIICIVLGKVFCSWICPVHFLSKLKPKPRNKLTKQEKKLLAGVCGQNAGKASAGAGKASAGCATCALPCGKSKGIKIDSRHGILAAALVSTGIFGFPVFCLICPIGLSFATVFLIMRAFAFGEATWSIVLFVAIILVEVILLPHWCGRFCPLGALLSLFSGLNKTFVPQVDESKCLNNQGNECNRCVHACPEGINLHDIAAGETTINDCSKCKACSDVCPAGAITFPLLAKKENGGSGKVDLLTSNATSASTADFADAATLASTADLAGATRSTSAAKAKE